MREFNPTPPEFPCAGMAAWGVDAIGPWQALVYKDIRYRFRWIPPGRFWMGSPESEAERGDFEDLHLVTLSEGFWLGETTVTQALWRAVTGHNPSHFKGLEMPVENVDWIEVQGFVQKLIERAQCPGLCLPSEAQWEYACRAGTETSFSYGDRITTDQVNFNGNYPYARGILGVYRQQTVPVASLPVNPWGMFEMHGNVWEWCRDSWKDHLGTGPVRRPSTTAYETASYVVRGGSWINYGKDVRSAYRNHSAPDNRHGYLGFRLARGHCGKKIGGADSGGLR